MRERWQRFTEEAETWLLDVIFQQRPGRKAEVVRFLLLVLSRVFTGIVKLRRVLYNARILRDTTLGVQVIAVGNLTVGGTGKTPGGGEIRARPPGGRSHRGDPLAGVPVQAQAAA